MSTKTVNSNPELLESKTEPLERNNVALTDDELEYLAVSEGDLATTAYRPPGGSCR